MTPYNIFTETYHRDPSTGGVALKVTTVADGLYSNAPETVFAYNLVNDTVWYDLSDVYGDPFRGRTVQVDPADPPIVWENGLPPPLRDQVRSIVASSDLIVTFC